jgi:uncharacterized protein
MRLDAPAAELTITPDEARRITLRAQGLLGATGWRGSRAGAGGVRRVEAMLRRVGAVQLDTISVLARSHELVAYARLGPVPRQQIEQAYWHASAPAAFEYWAHAACVLPLEQWPYFAFRRRAFRARGVRWHQSHQETCEKVMARLRAEGPLTATQLGGAKGGGPWWDWSDVKIAVEWLLDTGEVICVRRTGWRRVYDLPERVLPDDLLGAEPSDLECITYLAGVTARALGVVSQADLIDYHRLNYLTSEKGQHTRLVAEAALAAGLTPVTIVGDGAAPGRAGPGRAGRGQAARGRAGPERAGQVSGPSRGASWGPRAWADPAALAEASGAGRERNRVTLLSPFDSLVWDRKRTLRVFGFEHSLEAYVPKHKRIHGYYTMPLLAGGRLAGRVDPARDGGTLVARKVSLERASAAEPMARALREAAGWVGCDDVRLEQVEPTGHARRLAAALARTLGRRTGGGFRAAGQRGADAAQLNSISFCRTAIITASMREWIWSFSRMFLTWFFTVFSEMNSSFAMSRLFMPRATSLSTSISRSVSFGAATCWTRSSSASRLASVANSVSSLPAIDGLISDWPP